MIINFLTKVSNHFARSCPTFCYININICRSVICILADIYDAVTQRIEPLGVDCECLGGGRILVTPSDKAINVYGYSMVS